MKCRVIREDMEVSQADPRQMEGQTVAKTISVNRKQVTGLFWKVGAIISHPQAFRAVQMGVAIPADEECRIAANMSEERLAAAQHAYERLIHGIHPEDFAAYDSGYLTGYNADGSWIPGPSGGEREWNIVIGNDEPDEETEDFADE